MGQKFDGTRSGLTVKGIGTLVERREHRRVVVGGFTDKLIMEGKCGLHISGGRAGVSGWKPREAFHMIASHLGQIESFL